MKLIYLVGYGRSGTTILDMVLGEIEGFVSCGEVWYLNKRGLEENRYCGCGKKFKECNFWQKVVDNTLMGSGKDSLGLIKKFLKPISFDDFLIFLGIKTRKIRRVIKILDRLYSVVSKVSKKEVIIDSSKWPTYARILTLLPSFDTYLIYLVRDPRAIAYSWLEKRKYEPFADSPHFTKKNSAFRTAVEWVIWNIAVYLLLFKNRRRLLTVHHEDFVRHPEKTLRSILNFIHEDKKEIPIKNRKIDFGPNHCVSGNIVRFLRGKTEIKLNRQWRGGLSWFDKLLVMTITFPFMLIYRYFFDETV